jgi:hypothetical protein
MMLTVMRHREIYMAVLAPSTRHRLLATLEEEGILTLLKARALQVVDATPVPYVRLTITAGEDGIIAHCTGVWLDVRPLVEPPGQEDYYLPVLGVSETASPATIAHELLHLHDLPTLIERDPSYPERALKLGINSISEPSEIEGSLDFELFKIFAMERQWNVNGTSMERQWNVNGTSMERQWNLRRIAWSTRWARHGSKRSMRDRRSGINVRAPTSSSSGASPTTSRSWRAGTSSSSQDTRKRSGGRRDCRRITMAATCSVRRPTTTSRGSTPGPRRGSWHRSPGREPPRRHHPDAGMRAALARW